MQCPVCQEVTLVMADRQGLEIDYCPRCRGVWLDRGELDKLIERSAAQSGPWAAEDRTPYPSASQDYPRQREYDDDDHHYREYDDDRHYRGDDDHRRKKRGFLGEFFDFD